MESLADHRWGLPESDQILLSRFAIEARWGHAHRRLGNQEYGVRSERRLRHTAKEMACRGIHLFGDYLCALPRFALSVLADEYGTFDRTERSVWNRANVRWWLANTMGEPGDLFVRVEADDRPADWRREGF